MATPIILTAEDFRLQFPADFPYLPVWLIGNAYSVDDLVYFLDDGKFYKSLTNNNMELPTDPLNWAQVAGNVEDYVSDDMILRAAVEARMLYNSGLFPDSDTKLMGLCYLTAHFLCIDIRNTTSGAQSVASFPSKSRRAGSVSESVEIPRAFQNNPLAMMLAQTGYGYKYFQMVYPRMIGAGFSVLGLTV